MSQSDSPSSSSSTPDTSPEPVPIGQRVRFDAQCVLIPDPVPVSRLPRLTTKSFSVPLWRRRGREPSSISDYELEKDDEHVVLNFSVPQLSLPKPRSLSRSESTHRPLVPCIVNHDHSTHDPTSISLDDPPHSPRDAPSSPPLSPPASPRSPDLVTVPLRACCSACFPITEECIREGAEWHEHFTKGALRRQRSASPKAIHVGASLSRRCGEMQSFESVMLVDEADKKCKDRAAVSPPSHNCVSPDIADDDENEVLQPSFSRSQSTAKSIVPLITERASSSGSSSPDGDPLDPFLVGSPELISYLHAQELAQELPASSYVPISGSPKSPKRPLLSASLPTDLSTDDDIVFVDAEPPPSPLAGRSRKRSDTFPLPRSSMDDGPRLPTRLFGRRPSMENLRSSPPTRRRPHINLAGPSSFLRVSAEILKGVSMMGGGQAVAV